MSHSLECWREERRWQFPPSERLLEIDLVLELVVLVQHRPFLGTHKRHDLGAVFLMVALAWGRVVHVQAVVEVTEPEAVVKLVVDRHVLLTKLRAKNGSALNTAKTTTTHGEHDGKYAQLTI